MIIDLHHTGHERSVACYVLDTDDGPALFDCGPTTTIPALKAGLAEHGLELTDVRHLLLSHIHLDHAGAAGVLVREHPSLQVHVSEIGAPHLVEPERLERSARRLYGDTFDTLWGELAPVPARERAHRRRSSGRPRRASRRRAMRRTTSATSTATARSMRATRPACASSPAAS